MGIHMLIIGRDEALSRLTFIPSSQAIELVGLAKADHIDPIHSHLTLKQALTRFTEFLGFFSEPRLIISSSYAAVKVGRAAI